MTQRESGRAVFAALLLAACGSAAVPNKQLGDVRASIQGAETAGAQVSNNAAPHLEAANAKLSHAQQLIRKGDNEPAKLTLDEAQAEADLALAMAREEKERELSEQAKARVQELRTQLE